MNIALQKILHHVIGKTNLKDISVTELLELTDAYPYFSPGHFFLALKMEEEQHSNINNQLAKTVQFFNHNPFWLQYQLQEKPQQVEFISKEKIEETKPLWQKVVEEELQGNSYSTNIATEKKLEEIANIEPIETLSENTVAVNEEITIPTIEQVNALLNSIDYTEEAIEKTEEHTATETNEEQQSLASIALESTEENAELTAEETLLNNTINENTDTNITIVASAINHSTQEPIIELEEETIDASQVIENIVPSEENANIISPTSTNTNTMEEVTNLNNEEEINTSQEDEQISALLDEQLKSFQQPVTANDKLDIEVTPYHTIDYFASQGIKAEVEAHNQDKLSNQLRKFTDWLRQMKKVSLDNQDDLGTDPELENAIQGIAQNSNEAKEIVTETMAEVLEKQGKKDKAIQLYIKLSFLNPDKSVYFATKIQQLKGI